jgi:hypothetical protein
LLSRVPGHFFAQARGSKALKRHDVSAASMRQFAGLPMCIHPKQGQALYRVQPPI